MEVILYLALAIAILLSLVNWISLKRLRKEVEQTKDSITNTVSWAKEDLRMEVNGVRRLVKILSAGGILTEDMINEGRPYADMSAAEAEKLLNQAGEGVVIDVRTPSEFYAGHIPGARLIPLDEIENRLQDIPKEAKRVFVVCQSGTRSAQACEFLSERGLVNLVNIYDGTPAWPGKKELGPTIRPPATKDK